MFNCPNCKNIIDPSSNVCPYCGFRLKGTDWQVPPSQVPPSQVPPSQVPPSQVPPSQFPNQPSPQYSSPPVSGFSLSDPNFIASIAGIIIGVFSLGAWLLPLCGCPLSIIGLSSSIFGALGQNSRVWGIVGIALNLIGLIASLINSICGMMMFMNN